jgi:hypothetical protein
VTPRAADQSNAGRQRHRGDGALDRSAGSLHCLGKPRARSYTLGATWPGGVSRYPRAHLGDADDTGEDRGQQREVGRIVKQLNLLGLVFYFRMVESKENGIIKP